MKMCVHVSLLLCNTTIKNISCLKHGTEKMSGGGKKARGACRNRITKGGNPDDGSGNGSVIMAFSITSGAYSVIRYFISLLKSPDFCFFRLHAKEKGGR